ncbi:MAG: hypothetical protein ACFWT6_18240 [Virgibacillus proomii]|jgi:hypothetical protein
MGGLFLLSKDSIATRMIPKNDKNQRYENPTGSLKLLGEVGKCFLIYGGDSQHLHNAKRVFSEMETYL